MRKLSFFIGLFVLALAACGQADTGAPPSTSAPSVAAQQPTAAPTSAPLATAQPAVSPALSPTLAQPGDTPSETAPASPGSGLSVAAPRQLINAAQQQLAKQLKVSPDTLQLQSAKAMEWPDGSLGCPAEGMVYPQVVTPGFQLIFTDKAQSTQYEVHTGTSEAQIVFCLNQKPIDLSAPASAKPTEPSAGQAAPIDEAGKRLGQLAQAALARDLGQNAADVKLVAVEETAWNDSSLGCPQPGQNYLQVITPGYKITLEAQGKQYEYHTDTNQRVVRCDQP